MPSVNIYTDRNKISPLEGILPELRETVARELSCGDRKLASEEVSLRILIPDASLRIADTELEIKAHNYAERVKRQDEICLSIREYIEKTCPKAGSVYVWLQLSELGHSAQSQ